MRPILQVFYSIFSGLLLAAAIPNEFYLFGCPIFTLLAFIPLYLSFNYAKSYKQAFLLGFMQTISTHLASSFWLAYFKDFAALTLGASAIGTAFIGGFFGLFLYLPFSSSWHKNQLNENSLSVSFLRTPAFRIIYFASLWTIYEWVKSSGFLGYPWGTISATMFNWPVVMQLSAVTGTYGISFMIMIINCFIAELIILNNRSAIRNSKYLKDYRNNQKHRLFSLSVAGKTFGIFIIISLAYGTFQYLRPRKPIKELTTILVQQNLDPWLLSSDEESILLSQELTEKQINVLNDQGLEPDFVVWSEGCLQQPYPYSEEYYKYYPGESPLASFVSKCGVPFLFGGSYVRETESGDIKNYNAAIMYDEYGMYRGYYGKTHLVPFAEALPFIEYPAMRDFMDKFVGISAGWYPGEQYVYFEIPCHPTEYYKMPPVKNVDLTKSSYQQSIEESKPITVKFSTPICFDDAFTDVMRPMFLNGAELFVNITDDSWSKTKSSETQHFAVAAYRAIEYRTTLIRSANAGYSVVVTPSGKVINDQPLLEASSTYCNVPIYKRTMTTYARFGNWLPYTLILLFAVYTFYMRLHFKKSDFTKSERNKKLTA